ncbi:hypothetical protein Zmor_005758 [Zophobas morio]|uniref:Uncharacterized protein n=1 Tax=Zophobas morio TaxID=2755281 RepID=A0AA38ISH8_9CUCU|nr:hypothetical protein Zmor_005758 [Zophobas morio]
MYYNNFLHPPILAKYREHGRRRIVSYVDSSECSLHSKQSGSKQNVNKPVNGTSTVTRGTPSPKPNLNGNSDTYRGHPQPDERDLRGLQEGVYDAVKVR